VHASHKQQISSHDGVPRQRQSCARGSCRRHVMATALSCTQGSCRRHVTAASCPRGSCRRHVTATASGCTRGSCRRHVTATAADCTRGSRRRHVTAASRTRGSCRRHVTATASGCTRGSCRRHVTATASIHIHIAPGAPPHPRFPLRSNVEHSKKKRTKSYTLFPRFSLAGAYGAEKVCDGGVVAECCEVQRRSAKGRLRVDRSAARKQLPRNLQMAILTCEVQRSRAA